MKQTGLNRGKRQRIVTALDVGTSKICCLIAKTWSAPDWLEVAGEGVQFEVLGFGHHRAEGLKGGMVTHLDRAEHCIRSAVDTAERMAGTIVEDAHVAVTCGRLKSESFSASVALPSGAVREDDTLRIIAGARQYAARDKRMVLHALPTGYRLDDHNGIRDPLGMCGERLGIDIHAVTADEVAIRNLSLCVERCHLGVSGLVAAPYASALAVITPDEAKLGVACIDFGAGTTTLSVFSDGHFIHTDAIALGSAGITTDWMDVRADPCDDFFQYACGGLLAQPIPADMPAWGAGMQGQREIEDFLHDVLESASKTESKDPVLAKLGDHYAACMDTDAIEKAGTTPLAGYLATIAKVKDARSAAKAIIALSGDGIFPFFAIYGHM
jgi:Ethanolamine utilization protein EutJ (predicted chaperonin)